MTLEIMASARRPPRASALSGKSGLVVGWEEGPAPSSDRTSTRACCALSTTWVPLTASSWFALWCGGWALIIVLSLVPGTHLAPFLQFPHAETALHFAGYAAIAASAALFCRSTAGLAGIAILCIVVASTLELLQLMVPDRGPSLSDGAANASGAASGYVVAWTAHRLGRLTAGRPVTDAHAARSQTEEG